MCGRYTLAAPSPAQIRARFPVGEAIEIRRRYNVAPGDGVLALNTDRDGAPRGELLRWGLVPSWADSPAVGLKMINARVETVADKPAYRGAFQRFRCLIPADGFYEWQRPAVGAKRPFHITRADGGLFAFAGLWSVWRRDDHEPIRSCTILTTAANSAIAELHDRMPVILAPGDEQAWLDSTTPEPALHELLRGLAADETAVREVSTTVNDARYDGPECLDEPAPEPQSTLF